MAECVRCGAVLSFNEIGATKKFINRGAEKFFCLDCLAAEFKVPRELLEKKIEYFRQQGCTLFF